jgi:ribosome-binding protein aMBF1 (putative translation factor)
MKTKRKHEIPEMEELLNLLTDEEIKTGIMKPRSESKGKGTGFDEFKAMLEEAIVVKDVTEALERARKEKNLTLEEVGQRVGVSRARIKQLETSENIEVSTLVRVASAMGYKVQIALTSEDEKVILARG